MDAGVEGGILMGVMGVIMVLIMMGMVVARDDSP